MDRGTWWAALSGSPWNCEAAAAAKSLQSCPTLCDPIDGSPPGSSVPAILQARTLVWVAISFSDACMHAKVLQSCLTLCDPVDSSPAGSSIHRILQARILEWVAISFFRNCEESDTIQQVNNSTTTDKKFVVLCYSSIQEASTLSLCFLRWSKQFLNIVTRTLCIFWNTCCCPFQPPVFCLIQNLCKFCNRTSCANVPL